MHPTLPRAFGNRLVASPTSPVATRLLPTVLLALIAICHAEQLCGQRAATQEDRTYFQRTILPLVEASCLDCHSGELAEGELDLARFATLDQVIDHRQLWKKVGRQLRDRQMPPADGPELDATGREMLLGWLDDTLPQLACNHEHHAGAVTIRRLTTLEYKNTIRDLFGIECKLADEFPADEVGYGFDNIGDVLSVSPLLLEKYLASAESISHQVILDLSKNRLETSIPGSEMEATRGSRAARLGHILTTNGTISSKLAVPLEGQYEISVTAYGTHAGDDWVEMGLVINGRQVANDEVKSIRDEPSEHRFKQRLPAGTLTLGVSFNNDYYNPEHPEPSRRDRNLGVLEIAISGPIDVTLPAAHRRFFETEPDETLAPRQAAVEIVRWHAPRIFRRPVEQREVDRLVSLFDMASTEGESFAGAMQVVLQAMLFSPNFLYKSEQPAPSDGTPQRLNDFELASAISYFLWSSMPDDELFSLAEAGELAKEKPLKAQLARMLEDPRSAALIDNFAEQWLQLRVLEHVDPDPQLFPTFTNHLRQSMIDETKLFIKDVIQSDQPLTTLLTAEYTFLNRSLAEHYGLPADGLKDTEFTRVDLEGTPRRGLLTQASILTLTSNPTRTSPVKRGKWVLENLLADPPPPALPGVPQLDSQAELTGTLRQRMEQHRADPSCAACHRKMDSVGFALENFDAVGIYRTADDGQPIDAVGHWPDGTTFSGAAELESFLADQQRSQFVSCICEKLFTYALGRGPEFADHCVIDRITQEALSDDFTFSQVIEAIVTSEPFNYRSIEGGPR